MKSDDAFLVGFMSVYLEEWKHRDSVMWAQVFRFYLATLSVSLLPYTDLINQHNLFSKGSLHIVGIVMSICFLYISIAYGSRLYVISKTYKEIIRKLSIDDIKRLEIKDLRLPKVAKTILGAPIAVVLPFALFVSLIIVNIVFWIVG